MKVVSFCENLIEYYIPTIKYKIFAVDKRKTQITLFSYDKHIDSGTGPISSKDSMTGLLLFELFSFMLMTMIKNYKYSEGNGVSSKYATTSTTSTE